MKQFFFLFLLLTVSSSSHAGPRVISGGGHIYSKRILSNFRLYPASIQVRAGVYTTEYPDCLMKVDVYENKVQLRPFENPNSNYFCNQAPNSTMSAINLNPIYKQNYTCDPSGRCAAEPLNYCETCNPNAIVQDFIQFQSNGTLSWSRKRLSGEGIFKDVEISTNYYFSASVLKPFMVQAYGRSEIANLSQKENCDIAKKDAIEQTIIACHRFYLFPKCDLHHTVAKPGPGVTCQVNAFVWGSN